jgi:hypothetical protein
MAVTRASSESRDVEQVPHEKDQAVHDEFRQRGLAQEDVDFLANFSDERRKKVLRKVDVSLDTFLLPARLENLGS